MLTVLRCSLIRALPQRVVTTPRSASAAGRKERCRRSETSCRAPPRCSALKVSTRLVIVGDVKLELSLLKTIVGLKNVLYFEHKTEQQKPMLRLTKSALNEFSVLHKSHVYSKCRNLKCSGRFLQRGKLRSQQSKSV